MADAEAPRQQTPDEYGAVRQEQAWKVWKGEKKKIEPKTEGSVRTQSTQSFQIWRCNRRSHKWGAKEYRRSSWEVMWTRRSEWRSKNIRCIRSGKNFW
jgi:hypothetical protein